MNPSDNVNMDAPKHIQLVLTLDSITVHACMMQGVLVTQKFEGFDCYKKLVNFLKQFCPIDSREGSISAEIIVN